MDTTIQLSQCAVKLPELEGQGVLVKGGFVLTASHCLNWGRETGTGVVLGDHCPIEIVCATGHKFRLGPIFLDAVSDLAVLGPLDNQVFPSDCESFEEFCQQVTALDICKVFPAERKEIPLKAWSHEGFEIDCSGTLWNTNAARIWVKGPIRAGTSGGPIVTMDKELIAIVSMAGSPNPEIGIVAGRQPVVWRILPAFIREQILLDE